MTDIFISYSSKDRELVGKIATALMDRGYRVWWDTGLLSGDDFHSLIPKKLAEADCVIVVWTPNSVESLWVKAEANRGLRRKVLIPVLAGEVDIPIPFDMVHTDDFRRWQGDVNSDEFKRLLLSVSRHAEPSLLEDESGAESKDDELENVCFEDEGKEEQTRYEEPQIVETDLSDKLALGDQVKKKRTGAGLNLKRVFGYSAVGVIFVSTYFGFKSFQVSNDTSRPVITSLGTSTVTKSEITQPEIARSEITQPEITQPEMIKIEGGSFKMGCVSGKCNKESYPVHSVTVPDFFISNKISVAEWRECVASKRCSSYQLSRSTGKDDSDSIAEVSWEDAVGYAAWLSEVIGESYSLPNESQWAFIARDPSRYKLVYSAADRNEWLQDCWHSSYKNAPQDGSTWDDECEGDLKVTRDSRQISINGANDPDDRFGHPKSVSYLNSSFRLVKHAN